MQHHLFVLFQQYITLLIKYKILIYLFIRIFFLAILVKSMSKQTGFTKLYNYFWKRINIYSIYIEVKDYPHPLFTTEISTLLVI